MELELGFEGDIVERQELLNGTQIVTIEGQSLDGRWTLTALVSWNAGLRETIEGDLTIARDDGSELFGTIAAGSVHDDDDTAGAARFRIEYEVDGGSGAYEDATGGAVATGTIAGAAFAGTWLVTIGESLAAPL